MTESPSTSVWTDIGSFFLKALEDASPISVVDPDPTTLTPMPAALGGAAAGHADLATQASEPKGFLELLRAKAHYLLLPVTLIEHLQGASATVMFTGVDSNAAAPPASTAVVLGADTPAYLTVLGMDLGRQVSSSDPGPLGALYGELCRAWLQLASGEPWKALNDAGIAHYTNAATTDGGVDPGEAWGAAVSEYVATRVHEWIALLTNLSNAARDSTLSPASRSQLLDDVCAAYEAAFERTLYGQVDNKPLVQPTFPPELRDLVDEHLLGLNALTCHYAQTPLVGILDALRAMPVQPPAIDNTEVKRKIVATALAESYLGSGNQEQEIIWIYVNLVEQHNNVNGLRRSSAYKHEQDHYKVYLYLVGDQRYAGHKVGKGYGFTPGNTVKRQAAMTSKAVREKAAALLALMDRIADHQEKNPHPHWYGQGNGDDFNRNDGKWRTARAYWWLQEKARDTGTDIPTWVIRLPPDKVKQVSFIFDEDSIKTYYETNPVPDDVPPYVPSGH
ncbi:hypothetical protein ABZ865_41915 [Streptomyces sp. NPDC047085]|uniref:hypothetical protein n=1 Tax=Streptomyces sp. NPDC047085 TaxID=3155140 RepID=UPI0033D9F256